MSKNWIILKIIGLGLNFTYEFEVFSKYADSCSMNEKTLACGAYETFLLSFHPDQDLFLIKKSFKWTLYTVHCTLYTVHSTVGTNEGFRLLWNKFFDLSTQKNLKKKTIYIVPFTLYTAQCTLYNTNHSMFEKR